MRRSSLQRRTPLAARKGLTARSTPGKAVAPRKPQRSTGPDRATRALVAIRDGHACVCCGRTTIGRPSDTQHRNSRGMGGTSDPAANSPVNLLLMLRECHARVESRADPEDNAKGYWLRMGEGPALTPVMYFGQDGGFTAWLLADGSLTQDAPDGVTA